MWRGEKNVQVGGEWEKNPSWPCTGLGLGEILGVKGKLA